jgi:hypothetical protein
MRCFPILGLTPSLDVFPSQWSHLCCASTASISPPSLDGMDISHQRVPPHVARSMYQSQEWLVSAAALLQLSSRLLVTTRANTHAHDTIQAIQHIHTTLSAALTRSRLCAAVHYGITTFWRSRLGRTSSASTQHIVGHFKSFQSVYTIGWRQEVLAARIITRDVDLSIRSTSVVPLSGITRRHSPPFLLVTLSLRVLGFVACENIAGYSCGYSLFEYP